MSGLLCLKWNNHTTAFLKKFGQIRDKNLYCDATIVCQGKYFKVHRLILSTCSEYFEEIFENIECKHPFIVIKDIDSNELDALLNYMYLGEVNVLQDVLPNLIKAAEALKIRGLAVCDDDISNSKSSQDKPVSSNAKSKVNVENSKKRERPNNMSDLLSPAKKALKQEKLKTQKSAKTIQSSEAFNNNNQTENNIFKDSSTEVSDENIIDVKVEPEDFLSRLDEPSPQENLLDLVYGDECKSNEASGNSNDSLQQPQCSTWEGIASMINEDGTEKNTIWDSTSESFDAMSPDEQMKALLEPSKKTSTTLFPGEATSPVRNCPYCAYRTSRITHLKRHILCRHTNHRPHQCPYCPYKAVQSWHLQRHMMVHTGEKPFSCPLCPYKSSRNEQLRSHMFKHVKDNFKEQTEKSEKKSSGDQTKKPFKSLVLNEQLNDENTSNN